MERRDTRIYMIVDTKKIKPGEMDDCIEFKDDRKNPKPSKDVVNFTSEITAGQRVFWFGEPKDAGPDRIEITGIKKKSAKEPKFIKDIEEEPGSNGVFRAKVIDTPTKGDESYFIKFRIKKEDYEFTVDPKLTMAR